MADHLNIYFCKTRIKNRINKMAVLIVEKNFTYRNLKNYFNCCACLNKNLFKKKKS